MKVKELIKQLQEYNQDAIVMQYQFSVTEKHTTQEFMNEMCVECSGINALDSEAGPEDHYSNYQSRNQDKENCTHVLLQGD
jgi:hypothetical protein